MLKQRQRSFKRAEALKRLPATLGLDVLGRKGRTAVCVCGNPLQECAEVEVELCSSSQLSMSNSIEQMDTLESLHSPYCGNGQPGSCKYWILDLGTNGRQNMGRGRAVGKWGEGPPLTISQTDVFGADASALS